MADESLDIGQTTTCGHTIRTGIVVVMPSTRPKLNDMSTGNVLLPINIEPCRTRMQNAGEKRWNQLRSYSATGTIGGVGVVALASAAPADAGASSSTATTSESAAPVAMVEASSPLRGSAPSGCGSRPGGRFGLSTQRQSNAKERERERERVTSMHHDRSSRSHPYRVARSSPRHQEHGFHDVAGPEPLVDIGIHCSSRDTRHVDSTSPADKAHSLHIRAHTRHQHCLQEPLSYRIGSFRIVR